jgi:hypothetical protein
METSTYIIVSFVIHCKWFRQYEYNVKNRMDINIELKRDMDIVRKNVSVLGTS